MTIRLANYVLDKLIAPDLSKFTQAEIPDLREEFPQGPNWIANNLMNNAFRSSFTGRIGRYTTAFIRRAQHAFVAYHEARQATLDYLASKQTVNPSYRTYYRALENWENFAIQSSIGIDSFNSLNEPEKLFVKKDALLTPVGRLYTIANKIKHLEEREDKDNDDTVNDCVPLWLSNEGLNSFDGLLLTYIDAGAELKSMSAMANELQDARTFIDNTKKLNEQPE